MFRREDIKPGCALEVADSVGVHCDNGRRTMYRVWTPSLPGVWTPQVHGPCGHNMVWGLLLRTLGPTPQPTPEGLSRLRAAAREVRRVVSGRVSCPVDQWDFERVVASYGEKRLRVRYERARQSLLADGLCTRSDAVVSAFVKGEKLANYKVHKPRVIMARDPRYNLELASFLKPIEHELYGALRGWGRRFYSHTRLIGKGLGPDERAELIRRKMSSVPGLVACEIDGKSFESHFYRAMLRLEHLFYQGLQGDPRLRLLLRWQLAFRGRGEGVEYRAAGVRASGDFNTGMGNTLAMCFLTLAVARTLGVRFDLLADGDNALVFLTVADMALWQREAPALYLSMGFEMAFERPVSTVEEVVFGQSKPMPLARGWSMIRNPLKVLSHGACGYQHYQDLRGGLRVLKSVGYCEAVLSRGVPVLQEYAHALLEATKRHTFSGAVLDDFEYKRILARGIRWADASRVPVTDESRRAFELSWGVPREVQIEWEARLRGGFTAPRVWEPWDYESELPDGRDHWTMTSSFVGNTYSDWADLGPLIQEQG